MWKWKCNPRWVFYISDCCFFEFKHFLINFVASDLKSILKLKLILQVQTFVQVYIICSIMKIYLNGLSSVKSNVVQLVIVFTSHVSWWCCLWLKHNMCPTKPPSSIKEWIFIANDKHLLLQVGFVMSFNMLHLFARLGFIVGFNYSPTGMLNKV